MVHIPLTVALKALIDATTKGWDVYDRKMKETEIRKGMADQKQAHGELSRRLEVVEKNQTEQGTLMRELSEGLKQFGESMQAELETRRKQQVKLKFIIYLALSLGAVGFAMSLFVMLK